MEPATDGVQDASGTRRMSSRIMVALRVAAPPERAFAVFTREIGLWWQANDVFAFTRSRSSWLFVSLLVFPGFILELGFLHVSVWGEGYFCLTRERGRRARLECV